jgi:hypothetical protein
MYLAIYTRFRDEARWLREWIEYHRMVGVQHFFMIDHLSIDNPLEVLQPYIEQGILTYTRFEEELPAPGTSVRRHIEPFLRMNRIALDWAKNRCDWLAVIDSDEYLVPVAGENMRDLLHRYEDYPALAVNWQMFGTAGREKIPEGRLLCESLTWRAPRDYHQNKHVKLIIRPAQTVSMGIHTGRFKLGGNPVDTNKEPVEGNFNPRIPTDVLRLHHYFLRDRNFLRTTKVPRRISFSNDPEILWDWDWDMSQEQDTLMLRYVSCLRPKVYPIDWQHYLRENPDLKKLRVLTSIQAIHHWVQYGQRAKRPARPPPTLEPLRELQWPDWQLYQRIYPEVQFATPVEAHRHWFTQGTRERRLLPNWEAYAAANPDLAEQGLLTGEKVSNHWYENGAREGRKDAEPEPPVKYIRVMGAVLA